MNNGAYRNYFHIGKIGFKIPRYANKNCNPFLSFICGILMNVLERKRYKYYVLRKKLKQWNGIWQYNYDKPIFCPCYFSFFGLLNVYKHLPIKLDWSELAKFGNCILDIDEKYLKEKTAYLVKDIKPENFRCDEKGNLYCIDYGDFSLTEFNRTNIMLIDYK